MLARSAARLPKGEHWSYEVKWDGYRTLSIKDGTRVTLLSRNLKVKAGLTLHVRAELFPALKAIQQSRCPFPNLPQQQNGPLR
jgi:ATP-dependent DNA ligase